MSRRVFVAGASGAIGHPLVRELVAAGHDVTGMTRSEGAAELAIGLPRGARLSGVPADRAARR